MPSINIINDSDHLSFVSSVPSLTPHSHSHSPPHRTPSIAHLSRWVVNRISRRSLRDEYTRSARSDLPRSTQTHHHNDTPLQEQASDSDEERIDSDPDEERLKEEYAAYCRAFTGSGRPCPSPSHSRWTMEASVYPGRASSPALSPPSPSVAREGGGGGGEHNVPSPHFDPLDESLPQLQPPPRILTPAIYVQSQAQQRKPPPPEVRPVRAWWSTARRWLCARPGPNTQG